MMRRASRSGGTDEHHGGELIYLSSRKLDAAAAELGLARRRLTTELTARASIKLSVPLPPVLNLTAEANGSVSPATSDAQATESGLLRSVVASLAKRGLNDLDDGPESIREGHWFTFHRDLRFGVGSSDTNHEVRAFVLVDRAPVDQDGITPGLMMHGGPEHVLPPYRDDALTTGGRRSGSGTERLFEWARTVIEAIDQAPPSTPIAHLATNLFDGRPSDEHDAAHSMYHLFSRQDWLTRIPQLQSFAPCQGVARANFVAVTEGATVILGSPLYVQLVPLRRPHSVPDASARKGALSRLLAGRDTSSLPEAPGGRHHTEALSNDRTER